MTPHTGSIIHVDSLHKAYGTATVLDGVSFTVAKGSVYALLGPNGAGKTTTVNILSTLIPLGSGSAQVAGHDVAREPRAVRASISVTGQFAGVDGLLTGRENVTMMARLNRVPRKSLHTTVTDLLDRFDLTTAADRRAATYSGGMRRRLDLAISMIARPQVLFLDEPTTGLDPRSRHTVWQFVRELAADGVTVLLTTQYLEEADQLADRVGVLDHGRIVAEGAPADLKRRVGTNVVHLRHTDGRSESHPTDGTAADLRRVLSSVAPDAEVSIRTPSLDDVFLALTTRKVSAA